MQTVQKTGMVSSWSFVGAMMQIKVSIGLYVRWVTFAWCLALFTLRVSVRGLSCRTAEARGDSTGAVLGQGTDHVILLVCWGKDANQGQYWIVHEMGYVRVAFGALYVESQCSWAVVQNC